MNQINKLNSSNCRLCNASSLLLLKRYSTNFNESKKINTYDFACSSISNSNIQPSLYRCLNCGLIQIPKNESPNNFLDLYKNVVDKKYIDNLNIKYKTFQKAFNLITPFIDEKKNKNTNFEILDVGSYYGAFLNILEQNKIKATGIEPSKHAYNYSLKNCSQIIENTTLEKFTIKNNKTFHFITSWDVAEHVENIDIYFKNINKLLKNDGIFVFSTIFIDSLIARILGKYWHWIIPMHFSYFDKASMKIALNNNNFIQIANHNYTHHARVSYAIRGLSNNMPSIIKSVLIFISKIVPQKLILPFQFGDVKIIILKKIQNS